MPYNAASLEPRQVMGCAGLFGYASASRRDLISCDVARIDETTTNCRAGATIEPYQPMRSRDRSSLFWDDDGTPAEHKLLLAVIAQAGADAQNGNQREQYSARLFFASSYFLQMCDELDIGGTVRQRLVDIGE